MVPGPNRKLIHGARGVDSSPRIVNREIVEIQDLVSGQSDSYRRIVVKDADSGAELAIARSDAMGLWATAASRPMAHVF